MNIKGRLLIIGTGGHAKSVIDACEKQGEYLICGLIDDYRDATDQLYGYDVLGAIEDARRLVVEKRIEYLFIAVGDNNDRANIFVKLFDVDVRYATIIHPSAVIATQVTIGSGTAILANATVNTSTVIGRFCILNTNSSIDHDNNICDFASIAPNAVTGGSVIVGNLSAVCIGASVLNGKTIGKGSVVGAGSVVTKDVEENVVAYGNPCRAIRDRKLTDSYL